jgi:two-component system sensor histidine kinase KdpD
MSDALLRKQADLTPDTRGALGAMRDQALHISNLVRNLLDMARLQNKDMQLRLEWQSIEALVSAALQAIKETLAQHHVSIDNLAHLPRIECDGVLIERVLCNLLENIVKYTPPASTIEISAKTQGEELRVSLCTHGERPTPSGPESQHFAQLTQEWRKSPRPGLGLALAVSEAIITAHHGRIWAEPAAKEPSGVQFSFTLPLGSRVKVQSKVS